ncbi:hypothetical protein F5X98DRAFT_369501 [Xylaria grammica]|nr:hypothetical protein F5X98DRAFT_369501 [Xylaria grammica]
MNLRIAQEKDGKDTARHKYSALVVIIGGGIVGITLAIGLAARGVRVALYERASDFYEIGARIAFTGVARQCMAQLNPDIFEGMPRTQAPSPRIRGRSWSGRCTGLATVLALAARESRERRRHALVAALGAYNEVRYSRTQRLVRSSRDIRDNYHRMDASQQ